MFSLVSPERLALGFCLLLLLLAGTPAIASHFEGAKWTEATITASGQFNGTLIQTNSSTFRSTNKLFNVINSSGNVVLNASFPNNSFDNSDPFFEIMRTQPFFDLSSLPHGQYRIRMESCCRINNISNAPGDSYASEVTILWDGAVRTAPVFLGPSIVRLPMGEDFSFLTSAFLQNPEPSTFQLLTNTLSPDYGAAPIPGMNFNTLNGNFSMTAANTNNLVDGGAYVAKFRISAESGMTSDWDIMFRPTTVTNAPPQLDSIPGGVNRIVEAGQVLQLPIRATDPDAGDTVTIAGLNLPANASLPSASGNPAESTLSFSPDAAQVGTTYKLVVEARDNHSTTPLTDTVTISVSVVTDASALPAIDVRGGGNSIADGDDQPSSSTGTNFGTVLTGEMVSRTFSIHNVGNVTLNLTGSPLVLLTGGQVNDFDVTSLPADSVAPGSSTSFSVEFTPSATGSRETAVRIDNDDPAQPYFQFAIGGAGTATPVPAMEVTGNGIFIPPGDISPRTVDNTDFGSVDYVSGATLTNTFVVVNSGSADLDFTGSPAVTLTGPAAGDFEVIMQPLGPVEATQTTPFEIRFNPSGTGERRATVNVPSNDGDIGTYSYDIRGFGITGPNMRVLGNGVFISDGSTSPDAGNDTLFEETGIGSDRSIIYTIENAGSVELNLTGTPLVSISGANAGDFSVTQIPGTPVAANSGQTSFEITFIPSSVGNRNATINIPSDDPNAQPYNYDVRGTGVEVPDLVLSKALSNAPPEPWYAGDILEYTVTVDNIGGSQAEGVEILDSRITPASFSCGTVAASGSCSLVGTYQLTQTDIETGQIVNTASASSSNADDPNDVVVTTLIQQVPSMEIYKLLLSASTNPVQLGTTLNYLVVADNMGNVILENVLVTDSITTPSSQLCPSVAPTASCNLFATYTVTQADVDAGGVINVGSVTASNAASPPDASLTIPVPRNPSLSFSMLYNGIVSGSDPLSLGSELSYTITINNTGDVTLTDVDLSTGPPMAPSDFQCSTVAPGGECRLDAVYVVTQADVDAGGITNVASAATTTAGIAAPSDQSVSHVIDRNPELSLSKVLTNAPSPVVLGSILQYTATATNSGDVTLSTVSVDDVLIDPASVSCSDVAPGATCELIGTYTVTQADVDAGQVENTATASTPDAADPAPATLVTAIQQTFDLGIEKSYQGADTDPEPVGLGSILSYTVTATNTGTVTLDTVIVSDPGLNVDQQTCENVAPGDTCVLAGTYTVEQANVDQGQFENVATASSTQFDGGAPVSDSETVSIPQLPDAELVKSFGGFAGLTFASVLQAELTYTVTLTNNGNVTLNNVLISDPLPLQPASVSCAEVAVGSTCVLAGTYAVTSTDIGAGNLSNTAQAEADELASTIFSNSVDVPIPDLTLDVHPGVPDPSLESPGWAHFTAHLTNPGGAVSENVVLWIEVDGIDNSNKHPDDLRLEYFDGAAWIEMGWGGFATGDFPDISRQAWFLGRDGASIPGFPVGSGYDQVLPLRVNWPNANWTVFSSVESLDSTHGGDAPGMRTYLLEADSFVVESTAVALELDVDYGVGSTGASEAAGWAEFHARLQNAGGDVPENIALWIEVESVTDNDWLNGFNIEVWSDSGWVSLGWAGISSSAYGGFDRDSWFFGRDGSGSLVGFELPAGYDETVALRANFSNDTWNIRVSVESLYPPDSGMLEGERIYLNESFPLALASDSPDLSLMVVASIPALDDSNLAQDWAYFELGLENDAAAGDVPENVQLFVAVEDTDPMQGDVIEFWDGSQWLAFDWDSISESWIYPPAGEFAMNAGDLLALWVRVNFANAEYLFESSVAGAMSGQTYGYFPDLIDVSLVVPELVLSPNLHTTGEVLVGEDAFRTFTLTNAGESFTAGIVDLVSVSGMDFYLDNTTCLNGMVIGEMDSCTVTVGFAPTEPVFRSGATQISSDYNTAMATIEGTGIQPAISIVPSALNFGDIQINESSAPLTTSLVNNGSAPLTITGLGSVSGLPFTRVGGDCLMPVTLPPGDSCTVEYVFEPTVTGIASEGVGVNSDAPTSPDAISLVGTGVNRSIDLNPPVLNFGKVIVGETAPAQVVTVTNDGTTLLSIQSVSLNSTDVPDYGLVSNNCNGAFLPQNSSCAFSVDFTPGASGVQIAEIVILSDASGSPDQIPLAGTGIQADLELSPSSFDFGQQQVLQATTTEFLVTHTGDPGSILFIDSLSLAGDTEFGISGGSCVAGVTELQASESCSIELSFVASAKDTYQAILTVDTNVGLRSSALTGEGIAPVAQLTPESHDFGSVMIGETSGPVPFTLSNAGDAGTTLSIDSIVVKGAGFVLIDNGCPPSLDAGQSCIIEVDFQPLHAVRHSAGLLTVETGLDEVSASLSGVAVVPVSELQIIKTFLGNADEDNTGTVTIGNTLSYRVVATNIGNVDLPDVLVVDSILDTESQLCEVLEPEEECILEGTYVVTADDVLTGEIVNVASAETDEADPVMDSVTVPVSQADMTLVKELIDFTDESRLGVPSLGSILTYRITATNTGPKPLSNVVVVDLLLDTFETTCSLLQTAETCILEGSYVVDEIDVQRGEVVNTASANADEFAEANTELRVLIERVLFRDRFQPMP